MTLPSHNVSVEGYQTKRKISYQLLLHEIQTLDGELTAILMEV